MHLGIKTTPSRLPALSSCCTNCSSEWTPMSPQDSQLRRLVRKASHAPSRFGRAPAHLGRFARALAVDPVETLLYVPDAVSHQLFDRQVQYQVEDDFGSSFHQMLGVPWPCSELEGFSRVWDDIQKQPFGQGALARSFDLRGVQRCRPRTEQRDVVRSSPSPPGKGARDWGGAGCDESGDPRGHVSQRHRPPLEPGPASPISPGASRGHGRGSPNGMPRPVDLCPRFEPTPAPGARLQPAGDRHVRP